MDKCTCEFCRFPGTGVALDVVTFVDQVSAKRQMLDFLKGSFAESDEKKKAQGYAENKIGILLGEWGLGKTQLLKYFRTAINNSAGVLDKLVGELEDDERVNLDRVKLLDLTAVMHKLVEEDAKFEQGRAEYDASFGDYKGIAFRIDATKFRNELIPGQNVLVTLWNLVLSRCNLEMRIDSDEQIGLATKRVLKHFDVNRLFIFFDELEGLQSVESAGFEFGTFFQDFALQIKRVLDNEVTSDVSILLSVIPTVWDELMRKFETLGALEARSIFIDLKRLDLERAYQLILSRCGTLDNSPFNEGAVRTLLHASASNPRYLARLCRGVQSDLKSNQTTQYEHVLKHLKELPETSRKHYTFDQRGLDELLDGALEVFPEDKPHIELLRMLAGEIREVAPVELRAALGVNNVAQIRDALEDLCRTTIAGIYPVTRVMQLDAKKVLMSRTHINQQKQQLEKIGWLDATDIQIEGQRLKIWKLDYLQDILGDLATYRPDPTQYEYFLPVSESKPEELSALWRLEETSALMLARTLQAIAKTGIEKYRLSQAAIERAFPRHGAKEPPFEWVPEGFWHDAHAYLHDPGTPKEEIRELLMGGLLDVAKSLGARCSQPDRFSFRMELTADSINHSSYDDDKSVSCLVTFVSNESEIGSTAQKQRVAAQSVDFLVNISSTRLPQKPDSLETIEGRPTIEIVYYELDGKTQFKLELLAYLNQEATAQKWYSLDKWQKASKVLSQDCLGNVIDLWIQKVKENGYLVSDWELDEASRREPRRPLRAIRDVISIIPGLPVLKAEFDVELKRAGAREGMELELFDLLRTNGQIIEQPSGKVKFELLPTQQRIIEVAQRIEPREGEKPEEFATRIREHFWRNRRTNIDQELTRHVTVVQSLGYFDLSRDLDALIRSIQQGIETVLAEEDGATIDQYAIEIRRARGDIGAKRAERLQKELKYYLVHYERHRDEIRVLEQRREWLVPRVIRRRLIEIYRDVGEIIAVGRSPFEEGKHAVAKAEGELNTAYYDLADAGTDIRIRDHVIALKDYVRHPLLEQAKHAHREGKIHDDDKDQKSAGDFLAEIQEELKMLREEKKQVENAIQSYSDTHKLLFSKAKALSEKKGATERVAPIYVTLQRLDPKEMRIRFKRSFEGEGLNAGKKEIQRAHQELNEIKEELQKIEEITDDLAALEDIIATLGRLQERGEEFLKEVSSFEVEILSERYGWHCVEKETQDLFTQIGNCRKTYQVIREKYDPSRDRDHIDTGQEKVEEFQGKVEQLEESLDDLHSQVQELASELQQTFQRLWNPISDQGGWINDGLQKASALWRQQAQKLIQELFAVNSVDEFQALLEEDADICQHVISAADFRTRIERADQELASITTDPADYEGGEQDVGDKAQELASQIETIRQKASQLARSESYPKMVEQLGKLLLLPDAQTEHIESASGLVPEAVTNWQALEKLAQESIDNVCRDAVRYIEALSKVQLLDLMSRRELLETLEDQQQEFKSGNKSYSEMYRFVKSISDKADGIAKEKMSEQVKGITEDEDMDIVLALLKEVHRNEPYDLHGLLQLATKERSAIVLRLVEKGVFQGEIRLGDRK